ncbi:terminase family protein [Kineosporia sp. NBRC 101731]|uniref:phage terminase large subunit family protein n=1 Tax=Kineosporia sp. NBRC 101731 TaxID=3032199 RepID=UPI0024A257F9|nr:terminase family protein [Kineosporia sp. NBRC 101731]GLY32098.1 hypothetical protein Kisp02_54630 [Kineosporia sp. NBRC 101731]
MPYNADAFMAGFERGMRGKDWRQRPYPGPLDLLMNLDKTYVETPGLRLLSDELVAATVERETTINPAYLAISMGPQEGKSSLVARAYPLWLLMRDPDLRLMVISYDDQSSVRWGRSMKQALSAHSGAHPLNGMNVNLSLRHGSEAVNNLEIDGYKGGLVCVSLKGGITGKPADVIILDDVVKDRQTARSKAFKELWKDQWQTAITSRLSAESLVVMDHTRWTEDDPIGQQLTENGDRWRYVNVPAIVESRPVGPGETPVPVSDPLGRQEGEWLISARGRTPEQWRRKRADVGEADFWALYQGSPYPASGGLFKKNTFRFWKATGDPWHIEMPGRSAPEVDLGNCMRFMTVDLAASLRTSADWTVAAVWAIAMSGELLMLDLRREQVDPTDHWDKVVAPLYSYWQCPIYVEATQHGYDLVYTAAREGALIEKLEADTDKFTRAVPASRRMGQGQILFPPAAHWFADFQQEVLGFPTASHDDQVDVLAYAHRVRGAIWVPQPDATQSQAIREAALPPTAAPDPAFGWPAADIGSAPL